MKCRPNTSFEKREMYLSVPRVSIASFDHFSQYRT